MDNCKKCRKCKIEQSLDNFYKQPMMADGYMWICKTCKSNAFKEKYHTKKNNKPFWL